MEFCPLCNSEIVGIDSGKKYCCGIKCNTQGDWFIAASDDWRIFDNGQWRQMTIEEQLQNSI
jgi:hypothetical protein